MKILSSIFLAPIIFANLCYATPQRPYINISGGVSKMHNLKTEKNELDDELGLITNSKVKAKIAGFASIALGYNFLSNFRSELDFAYFAPEHQGSSTAAGELDNGRLATIEMQGRLKAKIYSLTLNSYVDLIDLGAASFFVGAGFGTAKINQELNVSAKVIDNLTKISTTKQVPSAQSASKTNFSYALLAGTKAKINDSFSTQIVFSYRDFGKVKIEDQTSHYKSYNVSLGLVFDL